MVEIYIYIYNCFNKTVTIYNNLPIIIAKKKKFVPLFKTSRYSYWQTVDDILFMINT